MGVAVHKLIYATSVEIAGAAYNELALDNAWYARHRSQVVWVRKHWKNFIVAARETLGGMLGGNYPESTKQEIYDALVLDSSLPNMSLKNQAKLN